MLECGDGVADPREVCLFKERAPKFEIRDDVARPVGYTRLPRSVLLRFTPVCSHIARRIRCILQMSSQILRISASHAGGGIGGGAKADWKADEIFCRKSEIIVHTCADFGGASMMSSGCNRGERSHRGNSGGRSSGFKGGG